MEYRCAAVAASLACLLGGCLSSGQSDRYQSMRQELERAQSAAASADVDPLAGASELDREKLLVSVLARNPSIAAARAAWQAALARYPQDTALPDPMFSYAARPASFGSNEVNAGNDFDLAQSFPFPGKLTLRGERALDQADAAQAEFEAERERLVALASTLFDDYWLAARALETNQSQLELVSRARAVALSRYSSGSGTQADVLGADSERAMLEHRGVELASTRRIALERINTLLHRAPGLLLPEPPRDLEQPMTHALDEDALVAEAFSARAELRAQAAQVRAREADVALARREFLPDFTLRGGYESTWQEPPLRPVVGVELNLPIELGRRRAALEEADARLSRERSRLRKLEDEVRLQVVSALERLRESQHLCEISQSQLLPAAQARAAAARIAFSTGHSTFLEWADAERGVRAAEEAALTARAGLDRRGAELRRALGNDPALAEDAR
jgi:outer membrane protein, heavy metal efflux system